MAEDSLAPVISRLKEIVERFESEAAVSELAFSTDDFSLAFDQLETLITKPNASATFPETVKGVFLASLCEELTQEHADLRERTRDESGNEKLTEVSADVWLACLGELRKWVAETH